MWGWGWSSLTEHLLTHARFWVCLLALQSRKGGESKEKKEDNNDLGVVTPTCEPSTHEAEAGGLLFQGYPRIYRKMLSLKTIKEKKWEKTSFWRCRAIGRAGMPKPRVGSEGTSLPTQVWQEQFWSWHPKLCLTPNAQIHTVINFL